MLKGQKGITLVALVITIIILLILAGVTISLTLGDNGIFNKTKTAVGNYANEARREANMVNDIDAYIQNNI